MKKLVLFAFMLALLVAACSPVPQKPVACTAEAKLCPDGTAVGRTGPNCDFAPCPEPENITTNTINDSSTHYPVNHIAARGMFCAANYEPVCGWFNSSIKCFAYPCAQTYSNSCYAAKDEKVDYYTLGECPKVGGVVQPNSTTNNTSENACSGRRPEVCYEIYNPVCGHSNSGEKTYSNDCFACADTTVVYWTQGVCSAVNTTKASLPAIKTVYHCEYPQPSCSQDYNPVCGEYVLNTGDTVKQTFNNSCLACGTLKVSTYTEGAC